MKKYTRVDVSEQELEDIVRHNAGEIEEGLTYVDHQRPAAGGRLDVLLVDSGRSLVVAELKVTEDNGMLFQGLDYYDFVATHVESFARQYKNHSVDPAQPVRLFLVAPTFSQALINRCKWLDLPISLFTYNCLKFAGDTDVVAIFTEQQITAPPKVVEVPHIDNHLNYITDVNVRNKVSALLDEIKGWKPGNVAIDPIKSAVSMKINGRVFAYLYPRRQHYLIATFDAGDEWKDYAVKNDDELAEAKAIAKGAMERRL